MCDNIFDHINANLRNNCVQKTCNKKFHYIEPHYIPRVKLESKQLRKTDRKICSNN